MSTMSISQLNRKKVSLPGMLFNFSDLTLIVLPNVLINYISRRWLTSKTQFKPFV